MELLMRTHEDGPTLDEYITMLERIRATYGGNLRVQKWTGGKGRHGAPDPSVAHVKTMGIPGRTHPCVPTAFYQQGYDDLKTKGPEVVRI